MAKRLETEHLNKDVIKSKQKVADLYNSLNDDEKCLLILIHQDVDGDKQSMINRLFDDGTPCKDYEDLLAKGFYSYLAAFLKKKRLTK